MKKIEIAAYSLLEKIRDQKPVVHHLTNWVTIYDCANIVKALGGSPVMAHAPEEVSEMVGLASALVLNIGTLTPEFIASMKKAALSANRRSIPVVLDVCGAGATRLRNESCLSLLNGARIDVIKGNVSEIARVAGESVKTKGVDASEVVTDVRQLAGKLASERACTVVVTGPEDFICAGSRRLVVKNGHQMMSRIVGTGCMAASVIGAFAAVERDLVQAAVSGLVCYEIAAELAGRKAKGPASFKEQMFDFLFSLDEGTINKMQKVFAA